MALLCSYEGARSCTTGPQTGAREMMSWFLGAYGDGVNAGIYNCRPVAGGGALSLHGEGRAADLGVRPLSAAWGWTLARTLVRHSRALGVQLVIWDRQYWSASACQAGWRPYLGQHPHTDHLHVELSWHAARTLTAEVIQRVIGGTGGGGSTGGTPAPSPAPIPNYREVVRAMQTVNLSRVTSTASTFVRSDAVKRLQGLLMAHGLGPAGLTGSDGRPDGVAGPATKNAVGVFQRNHRTGHPDNPTRPDHVVGASTWARLNGVRL